MKFTLIILFGVFQCVFSADPLLKLRDGSIKGKSVDFRGVKVNQFLAIPYAEPPLGNLRFGRPVPKKSWDGVLNVDKWGAQCMQYPFLGVDTGATKREDCLTLNVFTSEAALNETKCPMSNKLRPVMVWIHGGGFVYGSASVPDFYDGTALVAFQDVICVSINYRLGPFGFLHVPEASIEGNMGLWDQTLALQWVRDNIRAFGGDPSKVTIYGESAGSQSVSAHIVSPQSKGLFANAILQSGTLYDLPRWTFSNTGQIFAQRIGCKLNDRSCFNSFKFGNQNDTAGLSFWPISGDEFLPTFPEKIVANSSENKVNILLGSVGNEGAYMIMLKDPVTFNPINPANLTLTDAKTVLGKIFGTSLIDYYSDKYLSNLSENDYRKIRLGVSQALGDTILACPTYIFGRDLTVNGNTNVYSYYQTQKPSNSLRAVGSTWFPATHFDDIPMVFGHPLLEPGKFNSQDIILSYLVLDIWATFAKEGKPPKISYQEWLPWSQNETLSYPTMELNANKLGIINTEPVQFCLKNWPFPLEKPYWFDSEPGIFAKVQEVDNSSTDVAVDNDEDDDLL